MYTFYVLENKDFQMTFPLNPTTGYSYDIKTKGPIQILDHEYKPNTNLIGSGGTLKYTFRASGASYIDVSFGQMWDKTTITTTVYRVLIRKQ